MVGFFFFFSIFTKSCNRHYYLIPDHFHHPENNQSLPLSVLATLGNHQPTFCLESPVLDTSQEWYHMVPALRSVLTHLAQCF